jgi:hypothetical protein
MLVGAVASAVAGASVGEDVPEWLPEGAVAFLGFADDVYYDGTVVDHPDMIVESGNWGVWDPETEIVADEGMTGDGGLLTGDVLVPVLAGATYVADLYLAEGHFFSMNWADFPNWNTNWTLTVQAISLPPKLSDGSLSLWYPDSEAAALANGAHKIALTVTPTKLSFSIDGGAVVTGSPSTPTPLWNGLGVGGLEEGSYLRSLTIYDPQADAALPGLSDL